jgi:hypothetical protein
VIAQIPIQTEGLTFIDRGHIYVLAGREIPSVTQVLEDNRLRADFSGVPVQVLERARHRGLAVHAATHYDDEGTLDDSTVMPEIRRYLEAWRAFKAERRAVVIALEARYAHPLLGYGGTLDRVLSVPGRRLPIVTDIKTGDQTGVEFQTAAYAELFTSLPNHPKLVDRWSVQLHPERNVPYTVTEFRHLHDWRTFRSALDLTFARAARGRSWRAAA